IVQHVRLDRAVEAYVLNNLGVVYKHLGESDHALAAYEQSFANRLAAGDPRGQFNSLINLGNLQNHSGNHLKAREYHARALEISRTSGDKDREAQALNVLGSS